MSQRAVIGVLIGAAILYALGLNPFVMPESTDDITYYELGRSLAEGKGYTYHGEIITDWPPVYPFVISLFFRMGIESILVIKTLSILFAISALWLGFRLLKAEQRHYPALTILIFALFPTCLLYGVRTASEWLFMVLSFSFFLSLIRLRDKESSRYGEAVILGLLLGVASLTRMVGVVLGVGILLQMGMRWFRDSRPLSQKIESIIPEFMAASIGAIIFIAWRIYLTYGAEIGDVAVGNYDLKGFSIWSSFEPIVMLSQLNELFFQMDDVLAMVHLSPIEGLLAILVGILLVIGLVGKFKERRFLPTDAYAIATMLMLVSYEIVATRFFIAIAPFVISWLFHGIETVAGAMRLPARRTILTLAMCWIIGLLSIDLVLIFRGNQKDHGPLTGLISQDESAFYRNLYADLREASLEIAAKDPEAIVGVYGWFANFISAMGDLHGVNREYATPFNWYVGTFEDDGIVPEIVVSSFEKVRDIGEITLYRKVR